MKRAGTIRISGGWAKGRILSCAPGIRPTQAVVREALGSIWANRLPEARVLDLYSGSGAVGIECLSRGACAAVFVDSNPKACSVLRENLKSLGVQRDKVVVWECSVSSLVETLKERGERFDLIYADPPYDLPLTKNDIESWCQLLVPGGALAIELRYPRLLSLRWSPETQPTEVRRYGETGVLFFEAPEKSA